jgi:hypothetical protein
MAFQSLSVPFVAHGLGRRSLTVLILCASLFACASFLAANQSTWYDRRVDTEHVTFNRRAYDGLNRPDTGLAASNKPLFSLQYHDADEFGNEIGQMADTLADIKGSVDKAQNKGKLKTEYIDKKLVIS